MSAKEEIAQAVHSACTPREFESLVATLYEEEGYDVQLQPPGADDGIDLIATQGRIEKAVQVKRYNADSKVGSPTIRETIGSAEVYGADEAAVVTTSLFTGPAEDTAANRNAGDIEVQLIDGPELIERLDGANVSVTESGEVIESGGSGDGLVDELQHHLEKEIEKEAKDLQAELVKELRREFQENYQDQLEAKVKELGGYLVTEARDADFRSRAAETRGRLGDGRAGFYGGGLLHERA